MDLERGPRVRQLARARVVVIVLVSSGFVFALDQLTGDDVACGVLYTLLVLLGLWFREPWYLPGITAWSSILIAASALPVAWRKRDLPDYNHLLALVAMWGCAWAVARYQRTERSLDHARSTRELYFDMAGGIIVAFDREGRITRMNRAGCDLLGYVEEELITKPWLELAVPESEHQPYRALFEGLARGTLALEPHVGLVRTRTGEVRHVAWQHTLIRDEGGAVTGALGSGLDVTERRKAEQALAEQRALAQVGQLAALVAHEVRNAVAGIGGALQLISERLPAGSAEREVTKSVVDRTGALHRMVDDLLSYAKPRPQHVARASLAGILRAARVHFGRIPEASVFEVTEAGDDSTVLVDPELLEGVVLNLLLNASQAMSGRGTIRVELGSSGPWSTLAVVDAGPGVPEALRAQIFEPFFTTKRQGTGLGLAIARRVVESHGGEIHCESPVEESGGTRMIVRLPRTA